MLGGDEAHDFLIGMILDWVLVKVGRLHVLKGFLARNVFHKEHSHFQLHVLDGVLLAPEDGRTELGGEGAEALLLSDELLLEHPVVVDELGDVVADVVGEEDDDPLSLSNIFRFDVLDSTS